MSELTVEPTIYHIAFSAEEFAMVLSLINRPDMGMSILQDIYGELTEELLKICLSTAGHGLMAKGVCTLTNSGTFKLQERVEQLVFPFARHTSVFQVSLIGKHEQDEARVYLLANHSFTAHRVSQGFVHYFEHGAAKDLVSYLAAIYPGFGEAGSESLSPLPISMEEFGKMQNSATLSGEAIQGLANWPEDVFAIFKQDMEAPQFRGGIVRIGVSEREKEAKETTSDPLPGLLLLKGEKGSWVFNFPSTRADCSGTVQVVSKETFKEALTNFLD